MVRACVRAARVVLEESEPASHQRRQRRDWSGELARTDTRLSSATDRAAEAKTAADKAWVEALAAQVALCTRL